MYTVTHILFVCLFVCPSVFLFIGAVISLSLSFWQTYIQEICNTKMYINQSMSSRVCICSRATSNRLVVCIRNVQMIMSGYDFLKSQVLSCWRKVESVCDVVISSGRVFQTRGPATVNARSPTVKRLTDGTIRRLVPPERSVRRPGWSATRTSGPRYRGACTSV